MSEADSSAPDLPQTLAVEEEGVETVPESKQKEVKEEDQTLQTCENPSNIENGVSAVRDEEDRDKTLAHADELMEKGSKASKEGDYGEAVDCFSRAVEIRLGFLVLGLLFFLTCGFGVIFFLRWKLKDSWSVGLVWNFGMESIFLGEMLSFV